MNTVMDRTTDSFRIPVNSLELAGRTVDKSLISDNSAPNLVEVTGISSHNAPTASGLTDHDYPNLSGLAMGLANFTQIKTLNKMPLPPEVMEHFGHMQCHCMMGLFTEINRAWLTIDSDIYVWTYEHGSDVAYFDGLNETIVSVGLVKPKPGVFHNFIKYLLVLTTTVEIVVLGVTFSSNTDGPLGDQEEMNLVPDPVFVMPTDNVSVTTIAGTNDGRLFLGGRDGSLFEIAYQAESSWFGKRCKKINHSTGTLSFLVPSFLNVAFSEEDPIAKISIDNSRHILYTLTEKGSIEVYDLGEKGNSLHRVTKVSQASLVQQAMHIVKTLDSVNFRPIVSISAIESSDSIHIYLVAVTQTGVRLYLTAVGLQNFTPNQRPFSLQLVHVRLPPGFSANIPTVKPKMVHMANYRENCMVLIASPGPDFDQLWCLSSDPFPFSPSLVEAYTLVQLDGPAWAMAEIRHHDDTLKVSQSFPPLVVRQHMEPPRKYVVLTAQGAHIFIKLRPVDMLRQLLVDSHGPESDAVKAYFQVQKEEQACATSLILACSESVQNAEVAEWATRAFFMYGGEPKQIQNLMGQTARNPMMFNPALVSTPASGYNISQYQQQMSPIQQQVYTNQNMTLDPAGRFSFSAKHGGLYLYLCRILRPIWNLSCVQKVITDAQKEFLTSSVSSDECIWILGYLLALRSFLQRNTQISVVGNITNQSFATQDGLNNASMTMNTTRLGQSAQELQIEERQSLDALKIFVAHACEVLGLWKILCEHQIHLLIASLSRDYQNALANTTFKDLFLFGHDVCSALIVSLINSYLGDNASVDSISAKLRDVCPNLYKSEDAACSKVRNSYTSIRTHKSCVPDPSPAHLTVIQTWIKANEILLSAKTQQNREERDAMLLSALQLYKDIAPNMNLSAACQKFITSQFYNAVIDLCVTCAKKIDPENIAEHYYKANEPSEDQDGFQLYARRMEIYKEVISMLEQVYVQNTVSFTSDIPATPGPPPKPQEGISMHPVDTTQLTRQLISEILDVPDELLHVAVYDWMLNKQMFGELLNVTERSLENYLVRATQQTPHTVQVYDLLWKYYERNSNHSAAAKILNTLASQPGNSLTLKQRLEYLARAVMCMRSDKVGYAPHLGVFLRELEDKIDIARVQDQILNSIINLRSSHERAKDAEIKLNSNLYDITKLYEDFAEPFGLWECKLAIIHCSGHNDTSLIQTIWKNIIKSEIHAASGSSNDKMTQILSKVKVLAKEYKESESCFPLDYILRQLEEISCKLRADYSLVPNAFVSIDIPINLMISIYHRMLVLHERIWLQEGNEFHLYKSLAEVINCFINKSDQIHNAEKRKIISQSQDVIAGILSTLYSKPNTEELIKILRNLQSKLSRL